MSLTQEHFSQAVAAIRSGIFSHSALDLLAEIQDDGGASRLVSTLVFVEWNSQKTDEHAISKTMANLELLANTSQSVACVLMASLWPIANDFMMHDICNSIDLWISSCDSEKLTQQLQLLSKENMEKHQHYENLIQNRVNPRAE